MTVFHGSNVVVSRPDVTHSKRNIDFGPGFYVTTYKTQAERWANRKGLRTDKNSVVNTYEYDTLFSGLKVLRFVEADEKWLEFVAACRNGNDLGRDYDVIIGQVADDAVFEAVNMYLQGLWDAKRTLEEIRYYDRNDQIVFKNDKAISLVLKYVGSYNPSEAK